MQMILRLLAPSASAMQSLLDVCYEYCIVHRKILDLPKRNSASSMSATHNLCNFETILRKIIMIVCKDWSISLTL